MRFVVCTWYKHFLQNAKVTNGTDGVGWLVAGARSAPGPFRARNRHVTAVKRLISEWE